MLDRGIPERGADPPSLLWSVAHPEPERGEVRVANADADADRTLEEPVCLGEHAGPIVAVWVALDRAVERAALAGYRPLFQQVVHPAIRVPTRLGQRERADFLGDVLGHALRGQDDDEMRRQVAIRVGQRSEFDRRHLLQHVLDDRLVGSQV